MILASGKDASWTSPGGGVSCMPIRGEDSGADPKNAEEFILLCWLGNALVFPRWR